MYKKLLIASSIVALTMSVSACGGGSTTTKVENTGTQGQQLLDLKKALDQGVITESEYKRTKKNILKS
ncbi:MAG: SHOCT domain-containing protein [Halioglobus sp.]|nr:SHOCT domain-containing protein [Halioglobus sp.]